MSFKVKPLSSHSFRKTLGKSQHYFSRLLLLLFFFFLHIVQVYFSKTTETYKSSAFPGGPVSNCPLYEMIYAKRKSSGDPVIFISYSSFEFRMVLVRKNLPANAGDLRDVGSIPGSGRSPGGGHGSPLQCSCLENSIDREARWVQPIESQRIRRNLACMHAKRHSSIGS